MATEFTKKGYRLAAATEPNAFAFRCHSRKVYWSKSTSFRKGEDFIAILQILAPCTLSEIIATLRAWLSVYGDDELLEQVDPVAREAVDTLLDVPAPAPSAPPQDRQGIN